MALILSIETSTNVCSVAIHDEGKLIVSSEVHIDQSHASKLATLIDEARRNAGIELNQLKAVALSSGPGSYTGLRIGTSTAKGLCYALGIPLIAVSTLDLMSYQVSKIILDGDVLLCPMIDARRMEVYCQLVTGNLEVISPIEAKIIDESSFVDSLNKKKIIFFGNGADRLHGLSKITRQ
jgi:tRNA threonylcarbamoyladenosine biosynthesis protein TsaB